MSLVISIYEIIKVLIHLYWGKLSFINDVLIGEGAEVEPVVEANGMGGTFSKYVELSFEIFLIKMIRVSCLWRVSIAVCRC